jgi:hypothetical protein
VLKDGATENFVKVTCYDPQQDTIHSEEFISRDDITTAEVDINAIILYKVAMGMKKPELKKNLLNLAITKYGKTMFIDKIQAALGVPVASAAKATTPATGKYLINDNKVNVRAKPDEVNGAITSMINKDTVVEISEVTTASYTIGGQTAPWYHVVSPDGWVFGTFLSPAP